MHEKDTANEAQLEPSQTYMMEFFTKTVNDFVREYFQKSQY